MLHRYGSSYWDAGELDEELVPKTKHTKLEEGANAGCNLAHVKDAPVVKDVVYPTTKSGLGLCGMHARYCWVPLPGFDLNRFENDSEGSFDAFRSNHLESLSRISRKQGWAGEAAAAAEASRVGSL